MFIIVPNEKNGVESLRKLENRLSVDVLEGLYDQMESKLVSIQLPKFRIKQQLQLKVVTTRLTISLANFSLIESSLKLSTFVSCSSY